MSAWIAGFLLGSSVFINGVKVDGLTDLKLESVESVRFDEVGNVHIDAPQYQIKVEGGSQTTRAADEVPVETWWLVSQDNGSSGHVIRVEVNGALVRELTSGGGQLILDLAPWFQVGVNRIRVSAVSTSPAGEPFYLFIGQGSNKGGELTLSQPEVQFGVGADRDGSYVRDYEITVE